METDPNIEQKVEETLSAARKINPAYVPLTFTEDTMKRIRVVKAEPFFASSVLLKAAAVLILICLNVYTVKYIFESPAPQVQPVTATIDDLVNDYQVADVSTDWLNNKK